MELARSQTLTLQAALVLEMQCQMTRKVFSALPLAPYLMSLKAHTAAIIGQSKCAMYRKRGRVNQEYTTPYQRLLRGMGFQSTDESDSYLIQSILSSEKKKASSKKQQLIDEYIANPTGENARKLKNAGIKPSTVKAEQKKKKLDTKGRTESSMNKNDKKQYQYLLDW